MQTMKPVVPDKEGQYVCVPGRFHLAAAGFPEGKEEIWLVEVRRVPECDGEGHKAFGYTCPEDDGRIYMVSSCGHQFFGPIGDTTCDQQTRL